jgi:hypothetical protein
MHSLAFTVFNTSLKTHSISLSIKFYQVIRLLTIPTRCTITVLLLLLPLLLVSGILLKSMHARLRGRFICRGLVNPSVTHICR